MPRITDELGIKKSLAEIHHGRKLAYWPINIPESVRQDLERSFGHVITELELVELLKGLASGDFVVRHIDD